MFQLRITSGPLNAYIFASQLIVSIKKFSVTFKGTSTVYRVGGLIFGTMYGIWNLDFFRYLIPPSNQISPLQVVALEYTVAFYPLLLTHCIHMCSVTC